MDVVIRKIAPVWRKKPGATRADLSRMEKLFERRFPEDYKAFLMWSSGGEGQLGPSYVSLWAAREMFGSNTDYGVLEAFSEVVAIGTDAGGNAYALDFQGEGDPRVIKTALSELDPDEAIELAPGFRQWLESLVQ